MFAVWLVFEKDDASYFSKIITKLSEQYDSEIFEPHITAYGLVDVTLAILDEIVKNSIKEERQFTVEKESVSYSDDFWKTLFVEFSKNESLERINQKLTQSLDSFAKYEFKPHVSLIYKKMNTSEQEKLANTLEIKKSFRVSGICIQEFSEDISKWKIVSRYDLKP